MQNIPINNIYLYYPFYYPIFAFLQTKNETMKFNELAKEIHDKNLNKWPYKGALDLDQLVFHTSIKFQEVIAAHNNKKLATIVDITWMESSNDVSHLYREHFPDTIKGTVQDGIAAAIISLLDISAAFRFDMDFHIKHRLEYMKQLNEQL